MASIDAELPVGTAAGAGSRARPARRARRHTSRHSRRSHSPRSGAGPPGRSPCPLRAPGGPPASGRRVAQRTTRAARRRRPGRRRYSSCGHGALVAKAGHGVLLVSGGPAHAALRAGRRRGRRRRSRPPPALGCRVADTSRSRRGTPRGRIFARGALGQHPQRRPLSSGLRRGRGVVFSRPCFERVPASGRAGERGRARRPSGRDRGRIIPGSAPAPAPLRGNRLARHDT